MIKRNIIGLVITLILITSSITLANTPTRVYYHTATGNECQLAVNKYYLSPTAACQYRYIFGPLTLRSYRVTLPKITACYAPGLAPGCAGPPSPNTWYNIDSYVNAKGPGGIWWITSYFHVRVNGYTLEKTAPTTCEMFAAFISLENITCDVNSVGTDRWEVGMRWQECYVSKFLPFCHTKGSTEVIDDKGQLMGISAW